MYRAGLSDLALRQLSGFPPDPFEALIPVMADVIAYPADPLRTFPTNDPYVRRAMFGSAGLVAYVTDDAGQTVTLVDVTRAG